MKALIFWLTMLATLSLSSQEVCNNFYPLVSPDGDFVYFSSDRGDGVYGIYRADANGDNLIELTNSDAPDMFPAVSPDGLKVVFQRGTYDSTAEIYIMDSDGQNVQKLTENSIYDGHPSFSPDGQKIIFDGWDDTNYPEIFIMNIDGTNRVQLTNEAGAYWQSSPMISPDGTSILFHQGINANNHIVIMDISGGVWSNITEENNFGDDEALVHFSADGSKIVFATTEFTGYNNGTDIIIADADGSNLQQLSFSTNGDYYYGPSFHPNGEWIYYSFSNEGFFDINRINIDGTNSQLIASCTNTGIEEFKAQHLVFVYPNPARTWVQIETDINCTNNFNFTLRDVKGREVFPYMRRSGACKFVMNVSNLETGIYFITIQNGTETITKTLSVIAN